MASNGIKDRVAIVGMGCTPFGEHWDKGADDLLVDAAGDAYRSAGVEPGAGRRLLARHDGQRHSGLMLSEPLKIHYKPVTRLENMCATGSEALRNAAYAVASGAYDLAMAIGVEKLKDSGYSGLVGSRPPDDGTGAEHDGAGDVLPARAGLRQEVRRRRGRAQGRDRAHRVEEPRNGAKNPKAQFRKEVPMEKIMNSPRVAGMLGIFDCSGVSDGSAAAILCRAEDAHKYTDHPIFIKALSFVAGPAEG